MTDNTHNQITLCCAGDGCFAATIATQSSFTDCYNILKGFEGDKNEAGHRGTTSGWKAAKLPWVQS